MDYTCKFLILFTVLFTAEAIHECVPPLAPMNGSYSEKKTMYSAGDKIQYRCDPGFLLVGGNTSRTCSTSRYWTGQMPFCDKRHELLSPTIVGVPNNKEVKYVTDKNTATCLEAVGKGLNIKLETTKVIRAVRLLTTIGGCYEVKVESAGQGNKKVCGRIDIKYGTGGIDWITINCKDKLVGDTICIQELGPHRRGQKIQLCEVEAYGSGDSQSSCEKPPPHIEEISISTGNFIISRERALMKCNGAEKQIRSYSLCEQNSWKTIGNLCEGDSSVADTKSHYKKNIIIVAVVVPICLLLGCLVVGFIYYIKKRKNSVVVVLKERDYYNYVGPGSESPPQDHEYSTVIYEDIPLSPSQIRKMTKQSPNNLPDILMEYVQPTDKRKVNDNEVEYQNSPEFLAQYKYMDPQDALKKSNTSLPRLKESPFYGK